MINAIIKQANPTNMLARYEDVAKAGKQLVYTDMPQEVPLMVDLSLRVKDGNVRSIVFKSGVNGFHSSNPDFSLMRKRVKAAIDESKNPKAKKKSAQQSRAKASTTRVRMTQDRRDSSALPLIVCAPAPEWVLEDSPPVAAVGVHTPTDLGDQRVEGGIGRSSGIENSRVRTTLWLSDQ